MSEIKNNYYWIYILRCSNESYYTGYTTDLVRRYQEHLSGSAKCKYTRSFKPLGIAQCWQIFDSKNSVLKIEKYIKSLSKPEKEKLIANPEELKFLFQSIVSVVNDVF